MNRVLVALLASLIVVSLTGCNLFVAQPQPTPTLFPIMEGLASPTALVPIPPTAVTTPVPTIAPPTSAPSVGVQSVDLAPTVAVGGIVQGSPSGPYGVIGVLPGNVLHIRSGPGITNPAVGSFPSNANSVMRTGPSSGVGGVLWVEVQNPAGGSGWVHSGYLTEFVAPAAFCADSRAATLVTGFGEALKTSNGKALAGLVSPAGGWSVRLWRNGNAVVFHRNDARWVFTSTFKHNWGAAPGSGQATVGSFHAVVLPKLLDVFNAPAPGYTLACDAVQSGGANYDTSWPAAYSNLNYYSIYKPGTAGNELSWRTVLVGIEYVQGQPYLFSASQLDWEP